MNPKLQLNTGKLIDLNYISQFPLQSTLTSNLTNVSTGNIEVKPKSQNSIINISLFLNATFSAGVSADVSNILRILIYKNDNSSEIASASYSLVPSSSPGAISNLPINVSLAFADIYPLESTPIGEPILYRLVFESQNFSPTDSLVLNSIESLYFEELDSPINVHSSIL